MQGLEFELKDLKTGETYNYCYENGIKDYIVERAGEKSLTEIRSFIA
ncbi:MAG: hypothetical protein ACLUE7_01390 [Lachnospirales bacterium]